MTHSPKDDIRASSLAARQLVSEHLRCAEADALIAHLESILDRNEPVIAYVPLPSEPGFPDLVDSLAAICGKVLLPIARTSDDGVPMPLQWAAYRAGSLVAAPFGLSEPAPPWLPPTALSSARTVLVPALAVDRHGVRLGRGAGFYDRSLRFRDPAARLIAVVRDDELVDQLPAEAHDVAMTHALTPGYGLVVLGNAAGSLALE
ncbi:MAG: 5-formyltetrahydrofolate cyclo-ligase [Mycobacterium sp.]|nr:5-formyltetrahydrofolate cyclo-ligase [Mycobacterium sp.]